MNRLAAHIVLAVLAGVLAACATVIVLTGHAVPNELWTALVVAAAAAAGVSVPEAVLASKAPAPPPPGTTGVPPG